MLISKVSRLEKEVQELKKIVNSREEVQRIIREKNLKAKNSDVNKKPNNHAAGDPRIGINMEKHKE